MIYFRIVILLSFIVLKSELAAQNTYKLSKSTYGSISVNSKSSTFIAKGNLAISNKSISESDNYQLRHIDLYNSRSIFRPQIVKSIYFNQTASIESFELIQLVDVDVLDFLIATQPSNGSLIIRKNFIEYVPNNDFIGTDIAILELKNKNEEYIEIAIIVNVKKSNTKPVISKVNILNGNEEDKESLFTTESIVALIESSDVDGDDLSYEITKIHNKGSLFTQDGLTIAPLNLDRNFKFRWKPLENLNGLIRVFDIRAFDGIDYSQEVGIFISVPEVIDDLVVIQEEVKLDVKYGFTTTIDLNSLIYDPDEGQINYFIKSAINESNLSLKIDVNLLNIKSAAGYEDNIRITLGGEKNGKTKYSNIILNVIDENKESPFLISPVWIGYDEPGKNKIVDLKLPTRFWSFKTPNNISKSKISNWRISGTELNSVDKGEISITSNIDKIEELYLEEEKGLRLNNDNYLSLIVPPISSGADFAKRNNSYTLIFDVKFRLGINMPIVGMLNPLDKPEKAEIWLNPYGAVGGQGEYSKSGLIKDFEWTRLFIVLDGENNEISIYANNNLLVKRFINNIIDKRYSISENISIGLDKDIINKYFILDKIVYYDYVLNNSQIEYLAFDFLQKFQFRNEFELETKLKISQEGIYDDINNVFSDTYFLTLSTSDQNKNWEVQSTENFQEWQNNGIIPTDELIDISGNPYRYGKFQINKFDKSKLFYRVKSLDE